MLIGVKEFKVRLIPKPTINIYVDSNLTEPLDCENSLLSKDITYFTVKAIPDPMLAKDLPYDARYKVKSWRVSLVRSEKGIAALSFTTEKGDIQSILSQSKTGDKIFIEVTQLIRTNFFNRTELVDLGVNVKVIQI